MLDRNDINFIPFVSILLEVVTHDNADLSAVNFHFQMYMQKDSEHYELLKL